MSISDCLVPAVINRSSAQAISCLSRFEILPLRSIFLNTVSITRLNSVGESGSPCFTPLSTLNSDVYVLFTYTFAMVFPSVKIVVFTGPNSRHTSVSIPPPIFYFCNNFSFFFDVQIFC